MDDVRAATIGYTHRKIEIYKGHPSLQAAKTTRSPRVVRALRAQLLITLTARTFASLCEELKGKCLLGVDVRRSKMTLLKFPIMLITIVIEFVETSFV